MERATCHRGTSCLASSSTPAMKFQDKIAALLFEPGKQPVVWIIGAFTLEEFDAIGKELRRQVMTQRGPVWEGNNDRTR